MAWLQTVMTMAAKAVAVRAELLTAPCYSNKATPTRISRMCESEPQDRSIAAKFPGVLRTAPGFSHEIRGTML
jgi:hypothetical protein